MQSMTVTMAKEQAMTSIATVTAHQHLSQTLYCTRSGAARSPSAQHLYAATCVSVGQCCEGYCARCENCFNHATIFLLSKSGGPGCCVNIPSCNGNPKNDKRQKYAQYANYCNWVLKSTQCTLIAVHVSVVIVTQLLV
ncbi:TPA: hypothetical protein ACH3X1_007345 [Trebouxia sp. C0004]